MDKVRLQFVCLASIKSRPNNYYVILDEVNGKRRLPIIVGLAEAQAIDFEVENVRPDRPILHDLFKVFGDSFNLNLKEVIISDLIVGRFYSKMIWSDGLNEKEVDARPSDAIAIAIRMNAPIYSYEAVIRAVGVVVENNE